MSELTNRAGVAATQLAVNKIGWFFREQPISDQGVDAIVEEVTITRRDALPDLEEGTGRLLGLQIKGGASWFAEQSPSGWWFRFSEVHARRWLNLAIPLLVVLVDTDTDVCYWQAITPGTIVEAGKGFKVEVPSSHLVTGSSAEWSVVASQAAAEAPAQYANSLAHLPPSVGKSVKGLGPDTDLDVSMLALHLARGRHNPAGTVQALLTANPPWVTRKAPWSWAAIGDYASGYDAVSLAAQAFQRAAETAPGDEPERGRWLATAALHLVYTDNEKAAALTEMADEAGAATHSVAVLRAVLAHPEGDASPIPVPEGLDVEQDQIRRSAFVQSFLATRAQHGGDVEGALKHSDLALQSDPDNATLMEHRADMLLWAALDGHSDPQLQDEGIRLLESAIAQRRRWDGPTLNPTLVLGRVCMLSGRLEAALDACLAAPDGQATDDVASDPRVLRIALAAADGLDRADLVARISDSMGTSPADLLTKHRVGLLDVTDDERRAWLQAELDDAVAHDDASRASQSAFELADLGINASEALAPFVARSILPGDTKQLIAATASAQSDLDSALPTLRSLARSNGQAAAVLVDLLQEAGRNSEALAACDAVLAIRPQTAIAVARTELLIRLDHPAAEQAAVEAASQIDGFTRPRRDFATFAAIRAANRNDWDLAERRFQDVLALPGPFDADSIWRLVVAQLQTGHFDRARYTIDKHRPPVRTLDEAGYWLKAHAATGLDAARASEAIILAEKFNHPEVSAALLGLIVTGTNGVEPGALADVDDEEHLDERRRRALSAVPADLHRRAFEILGRLIEEHGETTGLTVIRGDDEQLLQQLADVLRSSADHDRLLADFAGKAQRGEIPIGVLAAVAGKGYATMLVQRALGLLPASSPDEKEHDIEVDAAASSMNTSVVADASALLTASGLTFDVIGTFSIATIPPAVLSDIYRARADIRGAASSPGSIRLDFETGQPVMTTLAPNEYLRQLQRVEALHRLASNLPVRPVTMEERAFPDLADEVRFDPWLEPLELAHELGCALWTDDLPLRRIAREVGLCAFGTPALLTAMNEQAAQTASQASIDRVIDQAAMGALSLAADHLVDIRLGFGDVLKLAQADAWEPGAGALALARASWWAWSEQRMEELVPLFAAVRSERPDFLGAWQTAAMLGAARAIIDPVTRSRVLCAMTLLGWDDEHPAQHLRDSVQRARAVAEGLGLPDPATELATVANLPIPGGGTDDEVGRELRAVLDDLVADATAADCEAETGGDGV